MLFLSLFPIGIALAAAGEALRNETVQSKMLLTGSNSVALFNMGGLSLLGIGAVIMVLAVMSFIM